MNEPPTSPQDGARTDVKYFLVVGGLLVLIIAMLAVLWVRERRNCSAAYRDLAVLKRSVGAISGPEQLQAALSRLAQGHRPTVPLRRDDLPAEIVSFDGKMRKVLRVGPAAGRRIGLEPGDVVEVVPEPTTGTTTQPSPP